MTDRSIDSIFNQPKEAIVQEPTPTPTLDLNALLLAALTPVLNQITAPLVERIAALEQRLENITTASDERIREIAIEEVEEQMAAHHNSYDHDEYDRLVGDLEDKVNDAVRDAVRELSFTVTVD
jgi:hypothetical protein